MHKDKEHDAYVRVDDAEGHGESIEHLPDDDAAFVRGTYLGGRLVFHEFRTLRIAPTAKECGSEKEKIEPIHHKGKTIGDECG